MKITMTSCSLLDVVVASNKDTVKASAWCLRLSDHFLVSFMKMFKCSWLTDLFMLNVDFTSHLKTALEKPNTGYFLMSISVVVSKSHI